MELALSSTSFQIPAVFASRLAGKKCGNFKIVADRLVQSFKLKTKYLYKNYSNIQGREGKG